MLVFLPYICSPKNWHFEETIVHSINAFGLLWRLYAGGGTAATAD